MTPIGRLPLVPLELNEDAKRSELSDHLLSLLLLARAHEHEQMAEDLLQPLLSDRGRCRRAGRRRARVWQRRARRRRRRRRARRLRSQGWLHLLRLLLRGDRRHVGVDGEGTHPAADPATPPAMLPMRIPPSLLPPSAREIDGDSELSDL